MLWHSSITQHLKTLRKCYTTLQTSLKLSFFRCEHTISFVLDSLFESPACLLCPTDTLIVFSLFLYIFLSLSADTLCILPVVGPGRQSLSPLDMKIIINEPTSCAHVRAEGENFCLAVVSIRRKKFQPWAQTCASMRVVRITMRGRGP